MDSELVVERKATQLDSTYGLEEVKLTQTGILGAFVYFIVNLHVHDSARIFFKTFYLI